MENVTFCESGPSRRQEEINLTALIRGLSFAERALEKDPEWIFLGRNQSGRIAGWCRRMKNEKEEMWHYISRARDGQQLFGDSPTVHFSKSAPSICEPL
jgi:hypothetical protein